MRVRACVCVCVGGKWLTASPLRIVLAWLVRTDNPGGISIVGSANDFAAVLSAAEGCDAIVHVRSCTVSVDTLTASTAC